MAVYDNNPVGAGLVPARGRGRKFACPQSKEDAHFPGEDVRHFTSLPRVLPTLGVRCVEGDFLLRAREGTRPSPTMCSKGGAENPVVIIGRRRTSLGEGVCHFTSLPRVLPTLGLRRVRGFSATRAGGHKTLPYTVREGKPSLLTALKKRQPPRLPLFFA